MSDLVQVPFHGDVLEAVVDDAGTPWISVKRVCEALGITLPAQLEKLKNYHWADVTMIETTAADGRNYDTSCISLKKLPMWLSHIYPSKVKPEVREKLKLYQDECADVLYEHFFGRRQLAPVAQVATIPADEILARMDTMIALFDRRLTAVEQKTELAPLHNRVLMLEAANGTPGVVGAEGSSHICRRITKITQTRTFEGSGLSFNSERGRLHAALRRHVNFHGTGGTGAWSMLPASRMVDANRFLDDAEVEAERVRKASGVEDKQGRLFQFPKPA